MRYLRKRDTVLSWRQMKTCVRVTRKLKKEIKRVFKARRLKVQVESEPVPGATEFRRVYVFAPVFCRMRFSESQDYIWRIAQDVLTREEQSCISMIVTLSPRDIEL